MRELREVKGFKSRWVLNAGSVGPKIRKIKHFKSETLFLELKI